MENNLSPSYIIDLIDKITSEVFKKYTSYKRVETYIKRWQKVIDFEQYGYSQTPVYNFDIEYKEKEKIDVVSTLNKAPDKLIIQMAVDLKIEVVGIIYSIAKIEGLDKNCYQNAKTIFDDAVKRVYDKPDEAIGLANSAFETVIKHILEQGKLNIKYNKKDTLYDLCQKILKAFDLFPSKDVKDEVNKIGSSLLCIAQAVETLRSEKTKFHGKDSSQFIIDDPLYACFVINCVSTVSNFLISFYEKKCNNENSGFTNFYESTDLISEDEIPF